MRESFDIWISPQKAVAICKKEGRRLPTEVGCDGVLLETGAKLAKKRSGWLIKSYHYAGEDVVPYE